MSKQEMRPSAGEVKARLGRVVRAVPGAAIEWGKSAVMNPAQPGVLQVAALILKEVLR